MKVITKKGICNPFFKHPTKSLYGLAVLNPFCLLMCIPLVGALLRRCRGLHEQIYLEASTTT